MLVNGTWQENWHPVQAKDEEGRFIRQLSSFRHWMAGFKVDTNGRVCLLEVSQQWC